MLALKMFVHLKNHIYHIHQEDHPTDILTEHYCFRLVNLLILLFESFIFIFKVDRKLLILGSLIE